MDVMPNATRLLLVDDDDFVRAALARALDQTGAFSVLPAGNGAQALEILASQPVDAVLTDLQMPTMDGLTLLGHLFERGVRLPVAVMSGQSIAPDLARRLHDYGIAATFLKPVDVGTLADELQRALAPEMVGSIRGITLFGLLQLLEVERKTALVVVRGSGHEGRLYFQDGTLGHAHARRLSGAEAVYEILSWSDPAVEIFYTRRSRQRTVTEPLQHVLMEAARRLDEREVESPSSGHSSSEPASEPASDGWSPGTSAGNAPATSRPASLPAELSASLDASLAKSALAEAIAIEGALGAALVDAMSGMVLAEAGRSAGFEMALAGAVATDLVRAQQKGLRALGVDDAIEDLMVTLGRQYHLICFVPGDAGIFMYLVLDRELANLGMARHRLSSIARRIRV